MKIQPPREPFNVSEKVEGILEQNPELSRLLIEAILAADAEIPVVEYELG